ncbi:ribose ABC transporter permease [Spirochaetia bacterium]|nr:ribose ABC transporter permease [Spirochaetia bacterium]
MFNDKKSKILGNLNSNYIVAPAGLVILFIFFAITAPSFFSVINIMNVLKQASVTLTVSVAMLMVIVTGGIDLSVGAILGLTGCLTGFFHHNAGMNIWAAMVTGLVIASLLGLVNGILIAKGGVPPFIATLGLMSVCRGTALMLTQGNPFKGFPDDYRVLGRGLVGPFPVIFLVAFVVLLIVAFVMYYTEVGRNLYAVGGNETTARYSGIKVDKIKIIAYTSSGLICGIASILLTTRINSAPPMGGSGIELDAIAACVIGGASLAGGEGSVWGALLGAMVMTVLANGLSILNVNSFAQQTIIGVVLIGTVFLRSFNEKRKANT